MLSVTSGLRLRTIALSTLVLASTPLVLAQAPTAASQPIAAATTAVSLAQATPAAAASKPETTPQAAINANPAASLALQRSQETEAASAPNDASHEGIHVHGHWIIDVHNPDGTLAKHLDFENSLLGTADLVGLLYGNFVTSDFLIYLIGSTPPCVPVSSNSCDIVHNLSVLPAISKCLADYCVTGLTVTPIFGANPALVLAGNMTATQAGNVSTVGTFVGLCGSTTSALTTTSAASCAAGNNGYAYGVFTQTGITPVTVISGQIIQVTVTITFS